MNHNLSFSSDKNLLRIHRERNALWLRQTQITEVTPPIPRGWIRHWRLTLKARNRHDAPVLQTILMAIDNPRYHWRKSFVSGSRRKRKMIENTQAVCSLREARWKRLGWPEEWKNYFRQTLVNVGRPDQTFSYKFQHENLFELFTERHYQTKSRLLDPLAESRSAELQMHLKNRRGQHRLTTLLDTGGWRGPDPRQKKLSRLAQQRMRKAMAGDWDAEAKRLTAFILSPPQPGPTVILHLNFPHHENTTQPVGPSSGWQPLV